MEPSSAKQTVYAIGVNRRRSTRSSVNSGMYAEMMISSEKKMGDSTSSAALRMVSKTVARLLVRSRSCRWWTMCSTITSVPSTMMPKSSAPRHSRFAGIPVKCMQTKANSSASGIVIAVKQRRAHAAQEQQQHRHHHDDAFQQRVRHRVHRVGDQVRAVVDAANVHARRQARGVDVLHRFVDALEHLRRDFRRGASARCLPRRSDRRCRKCP